jgi:tetratricopeptide (TPR) repeat protein/predicted Ser/Thr protein kinase
MKGEPAKSAQNGSPSSLVSSLGVGLVVDGARRALFGDAPTDVEASASTGPRIDRYVLSHKIGSGAMGTVYEARDIKLGRLVALKVLHRDLRGKQHRRMQREALALARLSHPNVVHLYEIGRFEDRTFIAMELVHGRTLDQWQRERRSWRECLQVYLQAGSGLASAHAAGLVHRDFKPSNCILGEDGRVRVLDFGLARAVGDDEPDASTTMPEPDPSEGVPMDQRLTETGAVLGTLAYMPPEQLAGKVADESSDQFGFCVSLYEALYGTRPFVGTTIGELMGSLMKGEPGAAPGRTRVPARVRRVILRGLAIDRRNRWPSMEVLLRELARVARGGIARSVWSVGVAAVLGAGAGVVFSTSGNDPCAEPEAALEGTWGEDDRAAVRETFERFSLPQAEELRIRVETQLDGYASAWVASYAESCHSTFVARKQSEELHDQRMRCLQRRRNRFESSIAVLVEADRAGELLDSAVLPFQLPSMEECADPERVMDVAPLPSDPAARERIAELRRRIDEAQTLQAAGDFPSGLVVAQAVVDEAREEGFPPVLAEALGILGCLQAMGGSARDAEATLEASIREAARVKDDLTAAKSWTWLVYALVLQRRLDEGPSLELAAQAAVDRADDDEVRGWLLNNLGALYSERGEFPRAREHLQEAIAVKMRTLGPGHVDVGISWANLGTALADHRLYNDARDAFERARTVFERTVGTAHPLTYYAVGGLCRAEEAGGRHARAVELCARVLEHFEVSPSSQVIMGRTHYLMARALHGSGRSHEAREQARVALELVREEDPGLAAELAEWLAALEGAAGAEP